LSDQDAIPRIPMSDRQYGGSRCVIRSDVNNDEVVEVKCSAKIVRQHGQGIGDTALSVAFALEPDLVERHCADIDGVGALNHIAYALGKLGLAE